MEEDVTISINGTDTTFPAGTYYGEIMQAQMDADGFQIMVILLQSSLKNSYVLKIFPDTDINVHIIQFLIRFNTFQQIS